MRHDRGRERDANDGERPELSGAQTDRALADNPLKLVSFGILTLYLFVQYGRLPELIGTVFGTSFYISPGLAALSIAGILLLGGLRPVVTSRIGIFLLAYHAWLLLASVFSFWKGGSLQALSVAARFMPIFLAVGALVSNISQMRRAVLSLAAGSSLVVGLCYWKGVLYDGRLALPVGRFDNSNDLAAYLLISIPLWYATAIDRDRMRPVRGLAWLAIPLGIGAVARTGSRGGLVTLAILAALVFIRLSVPRKILALAFAPVLCLALLWTLPSETAIRYRTWSDDVGSGVELDQSEAGAVGSTAARLDLLRESVQLTLAHPVFGVGPGAYMAAAARQAEQLGKRPPWQVTHNAYTEVSSGAGIPGLVLYVALLVLSLKTLWQTSRTSVCGRTMPAEVRRISSCLFASVVCFCTFGMFSSIANEFYLYMLAGMVVAITRVVEAERARAVSEALAAADAPVAISVPIPELPRETRARGIRGHRAPLARGRYTGSKFKPVE